MNITIRTTTRTDDKTGREITRFTPVLTVTPYGNGEIEFATWDAWSDDKEDMERQRINAEQSARYSIRVIAAQLADSREFPETDPVTLAMSRALDAAYAAGAAIKAAQQ